MGAFITERPEKTVSGNVSRWNAVTNPVIFKVERRDLNILRVINENGRIVIVAIGIDDFAPFNLSVGDRIYIRSGPYDIVGTIELVFSGVSAFRLDIPFSSNSSGGYINMLTKRDNYRIQARILKVVNNLYEIIVTTGQFRMDEKGIANIDISAWLRTLPRMVNEYDYVALNEADPNLGGNYIFQIRELFSDPTPGIDAEFPDPAFDNLNFFVNAARQLQSEHGGNMAQFVPFDEDVDESEKALFLSDFVEPSRFAGFPFDLQFIYSDNIAEKFIEKQERSFNINSVQKDSNSDLLTSGHNTTVNRLRLEEGYDDEAISLDVWLSFDTSLKALFGYAEPDAIDEDYDEDDFAFPPPPPTKSTASAVK